MILLRYCKYCGKEMVGKAGRQFLCDKTCANKWSRKQHEEAIDPRLLEIIRDSHDLPKHFGWRRFCKTCQRLKEFADSLTGITTEWMPDEQKYYKRDYR